MISDSEVPLRDIFCRIDACKQVCHLKLLLYFMWVFVLQNEKYTSADRGFTIIELMIAVALLAVIATIAVPSLNQFLQKNRVRAQAQMIQDAVSIARADALASTRVASVCWNDSNAEIDRFGQKIPARSLGIFNTGVNPAEILKMISLDSRDLFLVDNAPAAANGCLSINAQGRLLGNAFNIGVCRAQSEQADSFRLSMQISGRAALEKNADSTDTNYIKCT